MIKSVSRAAVCLLIFLLAGCSSYERRFAEASRAGAKGDDVAGAYSGRWSSSRHPGGGGELRCILTSLEPSGTGRDYRADFHATWHGFSSEHSVVLHTKPSRQGRGVRDFKGASELHTIIGSGTYQCEGTMDGRRMRAGYDATYDKGTFDVSRLAAERVASGRTGSSAE